MSETTWQAQSCPECGYGGRGPHAAGCTIGASEPRSTAAGDEGNYGNATPMTNDTNAEGKRVWHCSAFSAQMPAHLTRGLAGAQLKTLGEIRDHLNALEAEAAKWRELAEQLRNRLRFHVRSEHREQFPHVKPTTFEAESDLVLAAYNQARREEQ